MSLLLAKFNASCDAIPERRSGYTLGRYLKNAGFTDPSILQHAGLLSQNVFARYFSAKTHFDSANFANTLEHKCCDDPSALNTADYKKARNASERQKILSRWILDLIRMEHETNIAAMNVPTKLAASKERSSQRASALSQKKTDSSQSVTTTSECCPPTQQPDVDFYAQYSPSCSRSEKTDRANSSKCKDPFFGASNVGIYPSVRSFWSL